MNRYVCIHGHFYQPPRENPWLEAIELQDSAYPHHDWNARITDECYLPNARSRILDGEGRIVKIVNNYERISFNFGPTLLSWMEAKAPEAYQAILEADARSRERFSGHGSALAQAYNHMILPLSNDRDRKTQIIWGIRDFEHRFGRHPEGMWLPETAANTATLESLAEAGIRFTVLAPYQAGRVRPLRGGRWRELRGDVDPHMPYEAKLPSGRQISLFFYDGPISQAVAFERLLLSGETFANRLLSGFEAGREQPQLVHIATDGETYGHHHRHGDMALAYALEEIESNPDVALTNYGEYLERFPPTHAVEIVDDTSWSCAHGIERWKADCGCGGGGPEWGQHWRAPLREALDWLRDVMAPRYEEAARDLLKDPWAAREDHVEVILDRAPESVETYFAVHAARELSEGDKVRALQLLELQRHAMLMYTSCGWFFEELSRLETVQVIQYAGRVLQLARSLFGDCAEGEFLDRLARARSNLAEHGDGRNVYEKFVRPAFVDLPKVGAHYAISSLFEEYEPQAEIYCYDVHRDDAQHRSAGRARLHIGRAQLTSRITWETETFSFAVLHLGDHVVNGAIKRFEDPATYEQLVAGCTDAFDRADFMALIRRMDAAFGEANYSLASLFRDEQRKIVNIVLEASMGDAESSYRQLYESYAPLVRFLSTLSIPVPRALHLPAEFYLNARLRDVLGDESLDLEELRSLLEESDRQAVTLDRVTLAFTAGGALHRMADRFAADCGDAELLAQLGQLVALLRDLPFEVDLSEAQNTWYALMQQARPEYAAAAADGEESSRHWVDLFDELGTRLGMRASA